MSKMPGILRRDSVIFRLGVSFRQRRKNRDSWIKIDESDDGEFAMYYLDIRPKTVTAK